MEKLFGTDGIRGRANSYPITSEVCLQLGKAIAAAFQATGHGSKRAVIGKDTRISGYMLETALTSGLVSMGMDVYLVGPMPTPAVAHLTRSMGAAAGIMITASHNPAADNGIKIFNRDGFKLSDELQSQVEGLVLGDGISSRHVAFDQIGKAYRIEDASGRYIEFAKSAIHSASLKDLTIALDCANGAAYFLGPLIFKELGARVIKLGSEPDGYNINQGCGATAPEMLAEKVVENNADIGVALDGDADRAVFVDNTGEVIHGDRILAMLAIDLKGRQQLVRDTMVTTVMSNIGLYKTMKAQGINVETTAVGDRFVIEKLRNDRLSFGGEQSGHVLHLDYSTTGDGIITALQVLRQLQTTGKSIAELAAIVDLYPQKLVNVDTLSKPPLDSLDNLQAAMAECTAALGEDGRNLVRYSGTENMIRIMVEAATDDIVADWTARLVAAVEKDFS
ncbi:MAG: phosphoglucosamine mutase [Lentisphaeria bacterium]|jgi:phosphoglucosamine mutase|nr:phosphoglucosamine mutase [Lentisphaeria bacterium]